MAAPKRVLLIDNYDSFTYNLVHLFGRAGQPVKVVLNDAHTAAEIESMQPDGVILSAGPGTPQDAGVTLAVIEKLGGHVPLLGICLGHQAIACALGGRVIRAKRLLHGKSCLIEHQNQGVFRGLRSPLQMARYNSLLVDPENLPGQLEATAHSETAELMGLKHRTHALEGVQFHPESVLSVGGQQLVTNWLSQL